MRRYLSPRLEIRPRIVRPPVLCCREIMRQAYAKIPTALERLTIA